MLSRDYNVPRLELLCYQFLLAQICDLTLELSAADDKSTVMTRSLHRCSWRYSILRVRARGRTILDATAAVSAQLASQIHRFTSGSNRSLWLAISRLHFLAQGRSMHCPRRRPQSHGNVVFYARPPHTGVSPRTQSYRRVRTCLTFFLSESGYEAETEVLLEMKESAARSSLFVIARAKPFAAPATWCSNLISLHGDFSSRAYLVPAQLLGFTRESRRGLIRSSAPP